MFQELKEQVMVLPKNGRIVVIDDDPHESLSLITALSKKGYSVQYFSGTDKKEFPIRPLSDIRVIFLDIDLVGASEDKNKVSTAMQVLSSVINLDQNTRYLIVFWAKDSHLIAPIVTALQKKRCSINTVSLNKAECSANDYNIEIILSEIEKNLPANDPFNFFLQWENVIYESTNDIITDFLALYNDASEWTHKMPAVIKNLALAHAGTHLDRKCITKNAMLAFTGTYLDSLERSILSKTSDIPIEFTEDEVDNSVIAYINSCLLLCKISPEPRPGNIYQVDDDILHKKISSDFFDYCYIGNNFAREQGKSYDDLFQGYKIHPDYRKDFDRFCSEKRKEIREHEDCKTIICEISPLCDYSQKKWQAYRFVYGTIFPEQYTRFIAGSPFIFKTPILKINGNTSVIALNLRRLETKKLGDEIENYICTMRNNLIAPLQHMFSGHCSRPGMISL